MADLKAVIQSFYDGFNSRNYDAMEAALHDDFEEHEEGIPGMPRDKTAPRAYAELFTKSFSDFTMHVDDMVQEGDTVAARGRMTGTHDGEFMGMPATGKSFEIAFFDFLEFRDGKAVSHWGLNDIAGMMEQLGVGS